MTRDGLSANSTHLATRMTELVVSSLADAGVLIHEIMDSVCIVKGVVFDMTYSVVNTLRYVSLGTASMW